MIDRARLFVAPDGYLRLVPPTGHTYREVKEEVGASWDAATGGWKIPPLRTYALQVMEAIGRDVLDISEEVLRMGDEHGFPLLDVQAPLFNLLYDYQQEAVRYLVSNPHGSVLNVSPGLGKTAISIVAARALSVPGVLIVAPASLLYTWWREIEKWAPGASIEIAHTNPPVFGSQFTITTYDTVARHPGWFGGKGVQRWDLLIVDESVLVKNRATRRFKALQALRAHVDLVWLLSGSPTTRFADDLWTQLHLAYPVAFRSYWRFAERFCVFEQNTWAQSGKTIVGTRESRDLTWELGDVMLTLNQEDVLDLPEYLFETVDVPLLARQRKAYTSMLQDFLLELDGKELTADNKLAQLTRLQQVVSGMANFEGSDTASAKADVLLDLIRDGTYATPMIVWTHWKGNARHVTHLLQGAQINAAWVSGDDVPKARDAKLEAYKAGLTDVLVVSTAVGKFGHTLTSTRTVVYLDKTWAADDFIQSLRRVRRIGLTHRPVLVTLRSPGTTDDLLGDNLAGKMPSIAKVTNSQLKELLKGLGL